MKIVDNVIILPVVTTLSVPIERVLQQAMDDMPTYLLVIGEGSDGELYFKASESDGGSALWWIEKAKHALMGLTNEAQA